MALNLYDPLLGRSFQTDGSQGVSSDVLLLNILIELRAISALVMDMQRGLVTETQAQYRSDIVNATPTTTYTGR